MKKISICILLLFMFSCKNRIPPELYKEHYKITAININTFKVNKLENCYVLNISNEFNLHDTMVMEVQFKVEYFTYDTLKYEGQHIMVDYGGSGSRDSIIEFNVFYNQDGTKEKIQNQFNLRNSILLKPFQAIPNLGVNSRVTTFYDDCSIHIKCRSENLKCSTFESIYDFINNYNQKRISHNTLENITVLFINEGINSSNSLMKKGHKGSIELEVILSNGRIIKG